MISEIVEYRSRKWNELTAAGWVTVKTWTGPDGVIWAELQKGENV